MVDKFFMKMDQEQLMMFREELERRDLALRVEEITLMKQRQEFWNVVRTIELELSQKIRELHSRSYIIQENKEGVSE